MCRCRWLCWIQCCISNPDQDNLNDSFNRLVRAYEKVTPVQTPEETPLGTPTVEEKEFLLPIK